MLVRVAPRVSMLLVALFTAACAQLGLGRTEEAPPPVMTAYDRGVILLEEEAFAAAEQAFRASAARCDRGVEGRYSLLLLATLTQDPRNPAAHPDTAALMAARVLHLPDHTDEERYVAEGLYVSALDRGADPELRPAPEAPGLAPRFSNCSGPPLEPRVLELPTLEGPTTAARLRRLEGLADSLSSGSGGLTDRNRVLERRVRELEEELERIRSLLRRPDTTRVRRPPGP